MADTPPHTPPHPTPEKWLDVAFKVLSILVIPSLVAGILLYTEQQVQKERMAQMQQHITDSDAQVSALNARLNQAVTTMQETNGELREVRVVLGIIRERVDRTPQPRTR